MVIEVVLLPLLRARLPSHDPPRRLRSASERISPRHGIGFRSRGGLINVQITLCSFTTRNPRRQVVNQKATLSKQTHLRKHIAIMQTSVRPAASIFFTPGAPACILRPLAQRALQKPRRAHCSCHSLAHESCSWRLHAATRVAHVRSTFGQRLQLVSARHAS